MGYAGHFLLDNRPFVQIAGDVVAGGANQFNAAGMGAVIGAGAVKRGQKAVVDVDNAVGVGGHKRGRQYLHIARQHNHIHRRFLQQRQLGGFGLCFGVGAHRNMVEGDAVVFNQVAHGFVIADDQGNIAAQFADAVAVH